MANLVLINDLPGSKIRKGDRLNFKGDAIVVGSGRQVHLKLAIPGIDERHAQFLIDRDGKYRLWQLADGGTYVGDRLVAADEQVPLDDGISIRFGDAHFIFHDERQRVVAVEQPLAAWREAAPRARPQLTKDELYEANAVCGTRALTLSAARAVGWYGAYVARQASRRSLLPMALPFFFDLGALIAYEPPPLRSASTYGIDDQSLPAYCRRAYLRHFLHRFAFRPLVRNVRRQFAATPDVSRQNAVVAEFAGVVFDWIADLWLEQDVAAGANPDHAGDGAIGDLRVLAGGSSARQFLVQMSKCLQSAGGLQKMIDPIVGFQLAAYVRVPSALQKPDHTLIRECLKSRSLDEQTYRPEPIDVAPLSPETPSRNPGDEGAVRRVRKTSELARLPAVVPHEYALLRLRHGKKHLLTKLTNEGLLCWERHDFDVQIRRRSYLVCLVADIGPAADPKAGEAFAANSANTHARRLIFEVLRDLAVHFSLPGVELQTRVFLEPHREPGRKRLTWQLGLDELRARFGQSNEADMLALEDCASGFFFPDHASAAGGTHPERFIQGVLDADEHDFTLFVFLGPQQTVRSLMPADPPPPRVRPGVKDRVLLVRLGRWPYAVEAASGRGFDDLSFHPEYDFFPDTAFRYAILEEVMGERSDAVGSDDTFDVQAKEPTQ